MKVLLIKLFEAYNDDIVAQKLKALGHAVCVKTYYTPQDIYKDDKLHEAMLRDIKAEDPDAVFSINFWPPIARACKEADRPYLSWSYDSPINVPDTRDMDYSTNFIFLFDRGEVEDFKKQGLTSVYHMPLAVDTELFDQVQLGAADPRWDVCLLGSLYESTLTTLKSEMSPYDCGRVDSIVAAQKLIYGYYIIPELIEDKLISSINQTYKEKKIDVELTKKKLAYSISTEVTFEDRLSLLKLMGKRFDTTLVSGSMSDGMKEFLSGIRILDRVDYETGMPRIFKQSRINLNPMIRNISTGVNLRAYDVMGCGGFLMSSYADEYYEIFEPDRDMVTYSSMEEAISKADFYLKNDSLREQIALNGYEKVKAECSYEGRLKEMLKYV